MNTKYLVVVPCIVISSSFTILGTSLALYKNIFVFSVLQRELLINLLCQEEMRFIFSSCPGETFKFSRENFRVRTSSPSSLPNSVFSKYIMRFSKSSQRFSHRGCQRFYETDFARNHDFEMSELPRVELL